MSDIKMSDLLALPVVRATGGVMPFLKDGNGEIMFVGDGYHIDAVVEAVNSHDKLTARNAELESIIKETMVIIQNDHAVVDTIYYDNHCTLYEKLYLTINGDDKCEQLSLVEDNS